MYFQRYNMKYTFPLLLSSIWLSAVHLQAQQLKQVSNMQTTPLVYAANKINHPLNIDGKADESDWAQAPWTSAFIDIEGSQKAKPAFNTRVKMLWDNEHLYIYAQLEEPHIWGDITQHDAIIYHNNDFEVFIKPFEQQPLYYEIEVNALNTIMDLMMPKAYRLGGDALMHWDVKGLKSAVHHAGTINDPTDKDQFWAVEMAIPFRSLLTYSSNATPKLNSYWRINFSRVQWQATVNEETYTRKKDGDKFLPEDNWVWSPIGVINMHHPERWGYLQFVTKQPQEVKLPESQKIEQLAWNIFYLQQAYYKQHKAYADQIDQLPNYSQLVKPAMQQLKHDILLDKAKSFYKLTIRDFSNGYSLTLDSHGNYHTNDE